MDLFSSSNVQTVENPLPDLDNWVEYFSQSDLYSVKEIMDTVLSIREEGVTVYPEQENVLRAFREIHPDNLRVVILGQDPYFDGNATGHAFAVKKYVTPSLRQIFNVINDTCVPMYKGTPRVNLEYLVEQGVMLLNTSLTVVKNNPGSHKHLGWEYIIKNFLKRLSEKKKHLIFMLWGNYAQSVGNVINKENHYIYTAEHPASAARNNRRWTHDHFQRADFDLMRHGFNRIAWK